MKNGSRYLLNSTFLIIASTVIAMCMAVTMIFIRLKVSKRPATVKKIVLPPLFMSTGAFMFIFPEFRISSLEMVQAIGLGIVFSLFLIKTTSLEIKNNDIYLRPSKAFVFILFGLLIMRTIIKLIIGSTISFGETSGMFFLLAFVMILIWRLVILIKYLQFKQKLVSRETEY